MIKNIKCVLLCWCMTVWFLFMSIIGLFSSRKAGEIILLMVTIAIEKAGGRIVYD